MLKEIRPYERRLIAIPVGGWVAKWMLKADCACLHGNHLAIDVGGVGHPVVPVVNPLWHGGEPRLVVRCAKQQPLSAVTVVQHPLVRIRFLIVSNWTGVAVEHRGGRLGNLGFGDWRRAFKPKAKIGVVHPNHERSGIPQTGAAMDLLILLSVL